MSNISTVFLLHATKILTSLVSSIGGIVGSLIIIAYMITRQ